MAPHEREPSLLALLLGHCPGWSLQKAQPTMMEAQRGMLEGAREAAACPSRGKQGAGRGGELCCSMLQLLRGDGSRGAGAKSSCLLPRQATQRPATLWCPALRPGR